MIILYNYNLLKIHFCLLLSLPRLQFVCTHLDNIAVEVKLPGNERKLLSVTVYTGRPKDYVYKNKEKF